MKRMKKIFAMLLAFTMILGMTMTASAAKPEKGETATAIVKHIEAGATVTAYQIIEGDYGTNGFLGYKDVTPAKGTIDLIAGEYLAESDLTSLDSDEITSIAKQIVEGDLVLSKVETMNAGASYTEQDDPTTYADYSKALTAGYWVVLVSGTVNEVYNPMLVGVYYQVGKGGHDNSLIVRPNGSPDEDDYAVDANENWTLTTTGAYAKSTAPTINKSIVNRDGTVNADGKSNSNGKDVAVGDTVYFKVETKVPSYSKEYEEVIVKITDQMSEGLTLDQTSIAITGLTKDTDYVINSIDNDSFEIQLKSSYVLAIGNDNKPVNAGKDLVVTYSATVNNSAKYNFEENTNTASFIYSNDPADSTKVKTITDKTYTYTFAIDGLLNGTGSEVTKELFKVSETGEVEVSSKEVTVTSPLNGAKFTLTKENDPTKVYTAVSGDCNNDGDYEDTEDVAGALTFIGLDAGTYTLVETEAPAGYTINNEKYTVVIDADYNDDGTLKEYSVAITGKLPNGTTGTATSKYLATYTSETKEIIKDSVGSTGIQNTKLIALPSTGGIGTTIFTVAGCGIMIAAAFFFFASRKKENE